MTIVCRLFLAVFFTLGTNYAFAQLKLYPLPRQLPTNYPSKTTDASSRTQVDEPLSLPFWDDFSHPYLHLFPDISLWDESFSVWVNNGMGINPRTEMVATFDGLDSAGNAYNPQEIFLKGFTDSLVSKPINLSDGGDNPVTVAERSSVYLSFFYQWKGHGDAPHADEDFLELQFRDNANQWETVLSILPDNSLRPDTFYTAIVQVQPDRFFHNAFQFRFRSFGRQSGPYDTWNVDYVYLNKGRTATDTAFPDRAIASPLGTFLGRDRSMPIAHLNVSRQFTVADFDISNLQSNPASANYQARLNIANYTGNAPAVSYQVVLGDSIPLEYIGSVPSGFLPPLSRKHVTTLPLPDDSYFHADADSILFDLRIILNSGDNVYENGSTGDYTAIYEPIDFRANDTIQSQFVLSNYYAYDDGVAEYAAGLIETGNLVAYEFELPFTETFTQDTLVGFDIYFPPYGITSNQTVDFFIYHEDETTGGPGETWLRIPARRIVRKDINEFQRVLFIPALLIDEKKFFIGWKEPAGSDLLVGLDISGDTGDKMFVNTNNFWSPNLVVSGNFMIRPIFGSGQVDTQVGIEEMPGFEVYPNPSRGRFYINGEPDEIQILSSTGSPVAFHRETENEKTLIDMGHTPGLYIIRCRKGSQLMSGKIIIRQH